MAQPNGLQPKEELWLIGDGPQLAGWLELARQLGISDRVKPHPFVPHHTLPGLWDAIDIGVFPSSGDEAFGITIAEAMSRGKAVIASYVGGIPEVVGNENQCGWLCENSNAEAFAAAIVAAREADLQAMGNNGRGRVATQFRWSKLAEQFGLFLG